MGHPEHDLLFIATQVAQAAGLKNPKQSIQDLRALKSAPKPGVHLSTLVQENFTSLPLDGKGRAIRKTTIMFTEAETYRMLLRGHAPASEPFRKWVTEEVLPSIRKTGQQFAGE
ncbi:BRO-N domain-containing protein [Pseudomonas sp. NPDC077408]